MKIIRGAFVRRTIGQLHADRITNVMTVQERLQALLRTYHGVGAFQGEVIAVRSSVSRYSLGGDEMIGRKRRARITDIQL